LPKKRLKKLSDKEKERDFDKKNAIDEETLQIDAPSNSRQKVAT